MPIATISALWHYRHVEPNAKLFRAIVILGAALTAPACDEHGKCDPGANCTPSVDGGTTVSDARAFPDAPVTDATPMDVIVII